MVDNLTPSGQKSRPQAAVSLGGTFGNNGRNLKRRKLDDSNASVGTSSLPPSAARKQDPSKYLSSPVSAHVPGGEGVTVIADSEDDDDALRPRQHYADTNTEDDPLNFLGLSHDEMHFLGLGHDEIHAPKTRAPLSGPGPEAIDVDEEDEIQSASGLDFAVPDAEGGQQPLASTSKLPNHIRLQSPARQAIKPGTVASRKSLYSFEDTPRHIDLKNPPNRRNGIAIKMKSRDPIVCDSLAAQWNAIDYCP